MDLQILADFVAPLCDAAWQNSDGGMCRAVLFCPSLAAASSSRLTGVP
jgi:hypothetical protein